jgi:hypothetical protein
MKYKETPVFVPFPTKTHCINNWLLQWFATDGGAQPGDSNISCLVPFDWEETKM